MKPMHSSAKFTRLGSFGSRGLLLCLLAVASWPREARSTPVAAPRAVAPGSASAEEISAVRTELLEKAQQLAERAQKVQANVARDELYRAILCLDPDNKEARKVLGYSKTKTGWVLKKYVKQKDRCKPEDGAALAQERASLGVDFERRVRAALTREGKPTPAELDQLRNDLTAVMWFGDDNQELREEMGLMLDEESGEWRMAEVLLALQDRAERKELFAKLESELPEFEQTEVDESGAATGIGFPSVFATERAMVASTGKPEEAKRILRIVHIAPDFLGESFRRSDPTKDARWFIYDLANPNLRRQFYDKYPDIQGDRAKLAESGGVNFGYLCICGASDQPPGRYDVISNQRVGSYMKSVFGVQIERGWAWAGLNLFLSYQLCGTRLSLWIQSEKEDKYSKGKGKGDGIGERLEDPSVDWLLEARLILADPAKAPDLRSLLGRETRELSAEELVVAYALSAYLFEGRRDDLMAILDAMRQGDSSIAAVESSLQMSIESVRARLVQWLQELTTS